MTTTSPAIDFEKVQAFVGKVLNDSSATFATTLAALGDRLGLFKALADGGPATSAELASRAGIDERYAREWLGGMTNAGYLAHDPATGRFTLPAEHVPALAEEGGPFFFGGAYQMLLALGTIYDPLTDAFRRGGGVPQASYDAALLRGHGAVYRGLVQQSPPAGVAAGDARCARASRARAPTSPISAAAVAARSCGSPGAFPESRFVGYDVFAPNVEAAQSHAVRAGVADRVRFEVRDASRPLASPVDIITTFDVVHDAADPLGLLRSIRESLAPDGIYVCLEMNCSDHLEENDGPIGALFHGISTLYCMTTSLAQGGAGLGTLGLHERRLREYASVAGFGAVRLAFQDPFNKLYELR